MFNNGQKIKEQIFQDKLYQIMSTKHKYCVLREVVKLLRSFCIVSQTTKIVVW